MESYLVKAYPGLHLPSNPLPGYHFYYFFIHSSRVSYCKYKSVQITFCLHYFLSHIIVVHCMFFFLPCFYHLSWHSFSISTLRAFYSFFLQGGYALCGCTIIYLTKILLMDTGCFQLFTVYCNNYNDQKDWKHEVLRTVG